jgi:hypothetical protein
VRLSDLVGSDVLDAANRSIGRVVDVRLVQDYPVLGDLGAAFRIDCIIVGKHRLLAHAGLIHGRIRGPWLLKALARTLHGDDRKFGWDQIRSIEPGVLRIEAFEHDLARAYVPA